MRKKTFNFAKKGIAFILALSLVTQPIANIPVNAVSLVQAAEVNEETDTTQYINFEHLNHDSDFSDGVDTKIVYEGNTATITGKDWGNDWGGDSKWQIQLKELVPVTVGEKYDVSFKMTSQVDRNVFVKVGDIANDGTVFLEETIALEAGKPYEFKGTTTADVGIEQMMVLFALGDQAEVDNTITITDFAVKGEKSGYVVTNASAVVPDKKGPEYDFAATDNNAANDVKDPGTSKTGYDLIWADEFDGNYATTANVDAATGLNLDNWTPQDGDGTIYGNAGWGNQELQAYTGRKDNVGVNEDLNGDEKGEGLLRITASYEEDGYTYAAESKKSYTSARLHSTQLTEELFNTTYGYVEARMSLPGTKGAWPAFWMLPQSTEIYGGWPVSGEIDIMETCGAFTDGNHNSACGTLHRGAPNQIFSGSGYVALQSDYTYFHTYAIDWEPGKITWYYDGKAIHTENNWESAILGASDSLAYDAPFDQPFYILLNLAVDSGKFGGGANKATFEEDINMYVDYVRVYQKENGYTDSVVRTSTGEEKDDWAKYAGINQVGDVTAECVATVDNGDVNSLETSGKTEHSKWYLGYQADASDATAETFVDKDGKAWAKVGVNTAGGQDYSVQLIGHYDAKAGYVYKVSFDAYAEGDMVGKTVNSTSKEWKSWHTYGSKVFTLDDTVTSNYYLISQKDDFEDCRIEFNLGAVGTGNVYIGNVKVEIVNPEVIGESEGQRAELADGNVIYNGTFDQGNHRLGYWTAGEGTTVSVPRYTTKALTDDDVSVVDVASTLNSFEKEAKANAGKKYYERRAEISAKEGITPSIYQAGLPLDAGDYTLNFDMYSAKATTVTAAIYSADDNGMLVSKLLETKAQNYSDISKVKKYTWTFKVPADVKNAALVLTFGNGASVQLDNVSMINAAKIEKVDETPVDAESTWTANDGSGNVISVNVADGVYTVSNVTSGSTWYSPQITSSTFAVASSTTYKISAKLKLDGETNNTITYIVQEQNGSWTTVYGTEVIKLAELGEPDKDGFYTYEKTFTSNTSVSNVALNFGLGSSEAKDATFIFKDVTMSVVSSSEGENGGLSMSTDYDNWDKSDDTEQSEETKITSVKIIGISKKLAAGKNVQLKVKVSPSDAAVDKITWKSSNKKYATVNSKGKVTLKKSGAGKKVTIKATVYGKDGSKKTANYTINIKKHAVKSLTINGKKTYTIKAGQSVKLQSKVKIKTTGKSVNKTLKWISSNQKYATVSQTGKVTAKQAGKGKQVTITAKSMDGSNKKVTFTVKIKK